MNFRTFIVTLQSHNGQTFEHTSGVDGDAQAAMVKAEVWYNAPLWVGARQAALRVADNDGAYTQDGDFLVPAHGVRALHAEATRTDYVATAALMSRTGVVTARA